MSDPLMVYLPPVQQQPQSGGAGKYVGAVASGYDAKREQSAKWRAEQQIIEDMLSSLPPGSSVLDAPIGTGRFIPFYVKHGLIVRGLDISADMIKLAAQKIANPNAMIGEHKQFGFAQGDVRKVPMPDNEVNAAVNIRITRWLDPDGMIQMLREMQRVACDKIIFTARVQHPKPEVARPYDLINAALDGWTIHRDEPGAADSQNGPVQDRSYRIIELRPA